MSIFLCNFSIIGRCHTTFNYNCTPMYAFQLVYKASPYISKVMTTLNIAFSVIASSYLSTSLENLLN